MVRDRRVTAEYALKTRMLRVSIEGKGEVRGKGIRSCTNGTCTAQHPHYNRVGLNATAAPGYDFGEWTGTCKDSTNNTCLVVMTADQSTTAKFKPEKRTLSVTIVGAGTVTGTDGFSCSSGTCKKKYDYGTTVKLKARGGTGQVFDEWTGACDGKLPDCQLVMTADRSATATFKPDKRTLSVTIVGTGSVTATATGEDDFACSSGTCTKEYDYGTSVALTATGGTGQVFDKWTGDCEGRVRRCEMTADRSVTATFKPDTRTLSVTIVGTGSVTATATGEDDFACSSGTCTKEYDYGTSVALTATGGTGQVFDRWTGDCEGRVRRCEMTADRGVTATFKPDKRTLSVTISGEGAVSGTGSFTCSSGTCKQDYDYGTEVTLAATVNLTHDLAWSGCDEVDGATCEVTMTSDKAVTATYTLRCPAGCTASTCGSTTVCRCPGESCPSNYARHGNCAATASKTCTGETDGCGQSVRGTRCKTGSRSALANRGPEICLYEHRDRSILGCRHNQRVCRATITHVGCVLSLGGPVTPPVDFQDEEVWTKPAHGYILPNFECGTEANTCTVEFEDETVVTDDYGVVDKDDTDEEWRWECHSDNGTVRQCALPKDDG